MNTSIVLFVLILGVIIIYVCNCQEKFAPGVFDQLAARDPQDSYEMVGTRKYWDPLSYYYPYSYPYSYYRYKHYPYYPF